MATSSAEAVPAERAKAADGRKEDREPCPRNDHHPPPGPGARPGAYGPIRSLSGSSARPMKLKGPAEGPSPSSG
ncbi:MAG: hypothetical protein MZU91_10875 [Desulfosudis oleivorans]|nr:hypothetical protein [Desulfosudis oleivorans]